MAKKRNEHYVNNKEFYELLVKNKKIIDKINELKKCLNENKSDERSSKLLKEAIMKIEDTPEYRSTRNKLGTIYIKISEGVLQKSNFINYSSDRKEDMVSDSVFFMHKYTDRYDVSRTNPFAYFTTIATNAFKQYINKQKKKESVVTPFTYIENLHIDNNLSDEAWD